jgi:hypothetical protein
MPTQQSSTVRVGRTRELVTIEGQLRPEAVEVLWHRYEEAFTPLRELALLNHLYPRDEFERLVHDPRVTKIVGWRDGQPVGLAMVTPELEVVPQISPPFLRRRYPEHAARNAIFFGILVFVATEQRSSSLFARLVAGMGQVTSAVSGVIVFDMSNFNRGRRLDAQLSRVAGWFADSTFEEIDAQTYFAATLPGPLRQLPFDDLIPEVPAAVTAHEGGEVIDLREVRQD